MKILLFYVGHNQPLAFYYSAALFNKTKFLKENSDVILLSNDYPNNSEMLISANEIIETTKTRLIHTDVNIGYNLGMFEAISLHYKTLNNYDFVIALHPDYFIYDETYIKSVVENMQKDTIFNVNTFEIDNPTWYHSGFFIFRPIMELKKYFDMYKLYNKNPVNIYGDRIPLAAEQFLFYIVQMSKFKKEIWFRDMGRDHLENGIIHTHNEELMIKIYENSL